MISDYRFLLPTSSLFIRSRILRTCILDEQSIGLINNIFTIIHEAADREKIMDIVIFMHMRD
jgi:hypothetical protein